MLGLIYNKHQHQRCDDACDSVLIVRVYKSNREIFPDGFVENVIVGLYKDHKICLLSLLGFPGLR